LVPRYTNNAPLTAASASLIAARRLIA